MPLLDPTNTPAQPSKLNRQVSRLKAGPRQVVEQMVQGWESLFDLLWSDQGEVTPEDRLAAIGADGAELLQRSTALVTFLLTQLEGEDAETITRIQGKVAAMPAISVSAGGTVTIDPVPEPTPEP